MTHVESREAVATCRECSHEYIVKREDCLDCPACGFNFYWMGDVYKKFSGPKFNKKNRESTK